MQKYDKNLDGKIDLNEFIVAMTEWLLATFAYIYVYGLSDILHLESVDHSVRELSPHAALVPVLPWAHRSVVVLVDRHPGDFPVVEVALLHEILAQDLLGQQVPPVLDYCVLLVIEGLEHRGDFPLQLLLLHGLALRNIFGFHDSSDGEVVDHEGHSDNVLSLTAGNPASIWE